MAGPEGSNKSVENLQVPPGIETNFMNHRPGPVDVEFLLVKGSYIRFTLPPGGKVTFMSAGDILTINANLLPFPDKGISVVKDD